MHTRWRRGPLVGLLVALGLCGGVTRTARAESDVPQQRHLVELGVYLGAMLPSSSHELLGVTPHRQFPSAALDFGLRISYMPLYFLGLEVEGGIVPTSVDNDESALVYTVRGHLIFQYPIWRRLCPFLLAGGGLLGVSSGDAALGNDRDGLVYWGAGAKVYVTDWLSLRVDFRHDISVGLGDGFTSHFEVIGGAAWVFNWRSDSDGDGVPDKKDACPTQPAKRADGCPDRDGDDVIDKKDRCPDTPAKTADGCPLDPDGDGILGDADKCPNRPETKNGYQDEDGCPDALPQSITRFSGAIRGITFATGKARIRASSYEVLDQAVSMLGKHKGLRLVIRGHTDNVGKYESNMTLSLRRAQSVKRYLVKKGVSADRLSTEGLGPDEPVASNDTRDGRAKNRRIEFKIKAR